MKRSKREYLFLALKGVAMGAADVVPGVSGGTIAFISGIYEELLETISSVNLDALKKLKTEGIKGFWQHINGSFLLPLFAGILISVASLAKLLEYLLSNHPILLWSFFFGLILSSIWLVGKQIKKWGLINVIFILIGSVVAFYITTITPNSGGDNLWYIFLCGSIAIIAMILPGISGSFILILLGAYATVLGSISDFISSVKALNFSEIFSNLKIIGAFAAGCIVGLISFSKILNWLFKKVHDIVISILVGFLIGSLNKIWPWKETLNVFIKHQGELNEKIIPTEQRSISPFEYTHIYEEPNNLILAILFCVVGISVILILERVATKRD